MPLTAPFSTWLMRPRNWLRALVFMAMALNRRSMSSNCSMPWATWARKRSYSLCMRRQTWSISRPKSVSRVPPPCAPPAEQTTSGRSDRLFMASTASQAAL
ncbi:hypothetical protein D9M71_168930 [compost metagenome]